MIDVEEEEEEEEKQQEDILIYVELLFPVFYLLLLVSPQQEFCFVYDCLHVRHLRCWGAGLLGAAVHSAGRQDTGPPQC